MKRLARFFPMLLALGAMVGLAAGVALIFETLMSEAEGW
jgi:hypothetical protein